MIATLLVVALFIDGVYLLKRGFRAARTGDEPRCRGCGYQLQGITSDRCPECGRELSPANIVTGHRTRKPLLGAFGIVVIGLALVVSFVIAADLNSRIDWYKYRPFNWLIADLSPPGTPRAALAWGELHRRVKLHRLTSTQQATLAGQCVAMLTLWPSLFDPAWDELSREDEAGILPAVQRQALVDRILVLQQKPNASAGGSLPLEWVTQQLLADRLTRAQRETFLSQLLSFDLVARPQIAKDGEVDYAMHYQGHGPWQGLSSITSLGATEIDGVVVYKNGGSMSSGSFTGSGSIGSMLPTKPLNLAPGRHVLRVTNRVRIFAGPYIANDEKNRPTLWDHTQSFEKEFTVLPPGVIDPIELANDAKVEELMKSSLSITSAESPNYDGKGITLMLNYCNPPMDFAFDVFAVCDGAEHRISGATGRANANGGTGLAGGTFGPIGGKTVDFILRPNADVARKTVDLHRIWNGEIRISGVAIKPSQYAKK